MTIYKGSRYEDGRVLIENTDKMLAFRKKETYTSDKDDSLIRFTRGMTLASLAKEFYGDRQLRWVILDANPEYYAPDEIEPGDILVIPNPDRVSR